MEFEGVSVRAKATRPDLSRLSAVFQHVQPVETWRFEGRIAGLVEVRKLVCKLVGHSVKVQVVVICGDAVVLDSLVTSLL